MRHDLGPGGAGRGAGRARQYWQPGLQPDVDPARRALCGGAGAVGGEWAADRGSAGRAPARRCAADGLRGVSRAGARRSGMRRMRALADAVAALVALDGCSALQPYPTFPPEARPGEAAGGPRVAICYDTLVSSLDQVQAAAQQECAPNTQAT